MLLRSQDSLRKGTGTREVGCSTGCWGGKGPKFRKKKLQMKSSARHEKKGSTLNTYSTGKHLHYKGTDETR